MQFTSTAITPNTYQTIIPSPSLYRIRPLFEPLIAPQYPVAMDPRSPPFDWKILPASFSLGPPPKAATKTPKTNSAPPLPRQNSARWGTSAPPGHPGHYGRELGPQEQVPPGFAEHREINKSFFQPDAASTCRIEDHPDYPGRYAGEYKRGLRPPAPSKYDQAQESAAQVSQASQAQQKEAPGGEKEPSCCIIL